MMNTFRQHIPAFVDIGGRPPVRQFSTTEDLLALDIVQRYANGTDFSHFAMADNLLMSVSDDGFSWWVVGSILEPNAVALPKWEGWKFRAEVADGTRTVLSTEVVSLRGDVLTLRDGTKARNLPRSQTT